MCLSLWVRLSHCLLDRLTGCRSRAGASSPPSRRRRASLVYSIYYHTPEMNERDPCVGCGGTGTTPQFRWHALPIARGNLTIPVVYVQFKSPRVVSTVLLKFGTPGSSSFPTIYSSRARVIR